MPDRDDDNSRPRDQAHALGSAEEESAAMTERSSGEGRMPPTECDEDASPEEMMRAMSESVADAAADSIDDADDEIERLVAEVEALTGSGGSAEHDGAARDLEDAVATTEAAAAPQEATGEVPRSPAEVKEKETVAEAPSEAIAPAQVSEQAGDAPRQASDDHTPRTTGAAAAPTEVDEGPAETAPGPSADRVGTVTHPTNQAGESTPVDGTATDELPVESASRDAEMAGNSRPPEGGAEPSLMEIDAALAQDVEELLEGSYEVVSRVLDDVFDEHAIAVPASSGDGDAAETGPQLQPVGSEESSEESSPTPDELADVEAALRALTDSAAFESVEEVVGREAGSPVASQDEPQAQNRGADAAGASGPPPDERADAHPDVPSESAAASSSPPPTEAVPEHPADPAVAPSAPGALDAASAEPDSEIAAPASVSAAAPPDESAQGTADTGDAGSPSPASELLPPRETAQPPTPASASVESSPQPPAAAPPSGHEPAKARTAHSMDEAEGEPIGLGPAAHLRSIVVFAGSALVPLLRVLSIPLRFVPPPLRPLVDWIALSLVFWVPIVWIVVLFVMGR